MSMPEFPRPDPCMSQEQALTMILSSIAMEEEALSHILNAEGEKIQYILKQALCEKHCVDADKILAVNQSAANLLESVWQNQMILKNKMDKVLAHLPATFPAPLPPCPQNPSCPSACECPQQLSCPPKPLCPPKPECSPQPKQLLFSLRPSCTLTEPPYNRTGFCLVPGTYREKDLLQWEKPSPSGSYAHTSARCSKIQFPRTGMYTICFTIDTEDTDIRIIEFELSILCEDKSPVRKKIRMNKQSHSNSLCKEFSIQMPCSCYPCYAAVIVNAPCKIHIRQGKMVLVKAK